MLARYVDENKTIFAAVIVNMPDPNTADLQVFSKDQNGSIFVPGVRRIAAGETDPVGPAFQHESERPFWMPEIQDPPTGEPNGTPPQQ